MGFPSNDYGDGRCAEESIGFDVPSSSGENRVASGCQCGEIRDSCSGDEGSSRFAGQIQDVEQPPSETSSSVVAMGDETNKPEF